jgi:hypothetical protein
MLFVQQPEFNQDMLFYGFTREELAGIINRAEGGGTGWSAALADKIIKGLEDLASG